MSAEIQWRRYKNMDGSFRYEAQLVDGPVARTVGTVTLTGRQGVDDYPWDWWVENVTIVPGGSRGSGVADTLRSGKDQLRAALRASGL